MSSKHLAFLLFFLISLHVSFSIQQQSDKNVWAFFDAISRIPRCSTKEKRVIEQVIIDYANKNKFTYNVDHYGNIVVNVPATPGLERKPILTLQSHIDMVCVKEPWSEHNFDRDPIKFIHVGEWIKANGTTLGADDGIGAALALAVGIDNEIVHGPLELLFTVEEELGLKGALQLRPDFIKGKTIINLDTPNEGVAVIGCTGRSNLRGEISVSKSYLFVNKQYKRLKVIISGLSGGHSGANIVEGGANAIVLLGRLLNTLFYGSKIKLIDLHGGHVINAIPERSEADIIIEKKEEPRIISLINMFKKQMLDEFPITDPTLEITLDTIEDEREYYIDYIDPHSTSKIIKTLILHPHGVRAFTQSERVEEQKVPSTSINLARIELNGNTFTITSSIRSTHDTARDYLKDQIKVLFSLVGGIVFADGEYSGRSPNYASPILALCKKIYEEMYPGQKFEPKTIHAGIEIGVLEKIYDADVVSIGPTHVYLHTTRERLLKPSVTRTFEFLKQIVQKFAIDHF